MRGLLVAAALLAGCSVNNINFQQDERVEIVQPRDREDVRLPLTIEWIFEDSRLAAQSGEDGVLFGVFVDRSPMAPGQDVTSLADEECRRVAGCPDSEWLRQRNVYLTSGTSLPVETITQPVGGPRRDRELHKVVIVLLDQQQRRVGESAFSVEFFLARGGS